jgi:uncharacterized repeat protein (TIGR03803 family)
MAAAFALLASVSARATTFSDIGHTPANGSAQSLVIGPGGFLYGVVSGAGARAKSYGTVFKTDPSTGVSTVIYTFAGEPDGAYPVDRVTFDSNGVLYGATSGGGTAGRGTIFKLDLSTGKETVLHSFTGRKDGTTPEGGLVLGRSELLFGTTSSWGPSGCGTVFAYSLRNGRFVNLHAFTNTPDGCNPAGAMVIDRTNNLYGTTGIAQSAPADGSAPSLGTVFKVDVKTGTETVLHNFTGAADGVSPKGPLTFGPKGLLYGVTSGYPASTGYGNGTVFSVDTEGKAETVVYSFPAQNGGSGIGWAQGPLVFGKHHSILGEANEGGPSQSGYIWELDTANGVLLDIHDFTGPPDGEIPQGGLATDAAGNSYGVTVNDVIFKLTP